MPFANCVLFLGWGWVEHAVGSQSELMLSLLRSSVRELAYVAVSVVEQPHCLLFDSFVRFTVFISHRHLSWKTLLCCL